MVEARDDTLHHRSLLDLRTLLQSRAWAWSCACVVFAVAEVEVVVASWQRQLADSDSEY